jgi:hypothetical protein
MWHMRGQGWALRRRIATITLGTLTAWLTLQGFVRQAHAIPVFARKYATSCITCHTIYPKLNDVGEAFRRNGYQFPANEDVLVKEEPIKLGTDAYKEMFPNSIWPSTLPSIPPVSIFTLTQNVVNLTPHGQLKTWDFVFPSDIELIGAGAFGPNISGLYDIGFTPANGASVGRVFVQFSNLFSWSEEEDENGCHTAEHCWCVLPPHFLNLRVGKIDPAIVPHVISEESFAQFPPMPTNTFSLGQTGFILFAEQPAIEISGIYKQYWSYALGISNGGSAVTLPSDDNTFKDVYFNVTHRWFGYPLDGVLGQAPPEAAPATPPSSADQCPDADETPPPGLDFWRAWNFDTGVYGWFGKSNVPIPTATYDPNDHSTFVDDHFQRIGVNARVTWFDIDIYGTAFWGHDPFPGFDQSNIAVGETDHWGYMAEMDWMVKPWICAFLRYEQVSIDRPQFRYQEQARVVPGVVFAIRQNLHLSSEVYIDTRGNDIPNDAIPESTTQWITTLWWAY